MKNSSLIIIFLILFTSNLFADQDSDEKIIYSSEKECIAIKDTLIVSLKSQNVIAVRYSYQEYDSLDCYIYTSLPNIVNLNGEDFFYNFAASFLTRSFIWANLLVKKIEGDIFKQNNDIVWADIEGIMVNAMREVNPETIILRHNNYKAKYVNYYEKPLMDSFLSRHVKVEKGENSGWLHIAIRFNKSPR